MTTSLYYIFGNEQGPSFNLLEYLADIQADDTKYYNDKPAEEPDGEHQRSETFYN